MSKLKIEIKNRWTGSILFEYESENNTTKETAVQAVKRGANLQGADLQGAYLEGADLKGADLQGADLQGAYLEGADLKGADLQGAYLEGAYLGGAYLGGAYLQGADLQGAYLGGAYLEGAYLGGANLEGAYLGGAKVKTAAVFTGLYRYIVIPYITESGEHRVKMGCYDRSVSEWDADFWNNQSEFPNDESIKSKLRAMAYETAKAWLKINQ